MAVQQIKSFKGNKFLILQTTPSPLPTGTSIIKENRATGTLTLSTTVSKDLFKVVYHQTDCQTEWRSFRT